MMTKDKTLFIWRENDEWWDVDEVTNKAYLTEKAPPEALESFKRLLRKTGVPKKQVEKYKPGDRT